VMASGIGIEGSLRGAKEVVVRVVCVTLLVSFHLLCEDQLTQSPPQHPRIEGSKAYYSN
jgi:hypothetical protein